MSSAAAPTSAAGGGTSEDRQQIHNNNRNNVAENSDGGGNTMAKQMKRARRVSFAEMTSVHFFDRDEEYETPPELPGKAENGTERYEVNLGFDQLVDDFKELEEREDTDKGNDGNDVDDDDEDDEMASFLRPMESSSPGSNFGSATSNDENNFFGPVCPDFIRPGRLSDSAMSDEHQDITMDSTAFSMHFRSLAQSESGLDVKTPTGELSAEEQTPTHTTRGSFMSLTMNRKPIPQPSTPIANYSGVSDSSDMSLIGETMQRYNYDENFSPDLEALLAEDQERLHADSVPGNTSVSMSPNKKMEIGSGIIDFGGDAEQEVNAVVSLDVPPKPLCQKIDNVDDGYKFLSHAAEDDSLLRSTGPASDNDVDRVNRSPKQLSKDVPSHKFLDVGESNKSVKDASEVENSETVCSKDSKIGEFSGSPCGRESPLVDLMSSSPVKQSLLLMGSPARVKQNSMVVSSLEEPISFLSNEKTGPSGSSASLRKSISKLERIKASLLSSSLGDRIPYMDIRSLEFPKTPPLDSILKKRNKETGLDASCTEEQFSGVSSKWGEESNKFALDCRKSEALSSSKEVIQCEQALGPQKHGISLNQLHAGIPPTDQLLKQADSLTPSRFSLSGKKNNMFTSIDLRQNVPPTSITDSSLPDYSGQNKVTAVAHKLVFSPEKSLQSKSSTWSEQQSSPSNDSRLHEYNTVYASTGEAAQSPLLNQSSGRPRNSSAQKRRNEELTLGDMEHIDEINVIQRSPKLPRGVCSSPGIGHPDYSGKEILTGHLELRHWKDINSKLLEDADEWVSFPKERPTMPMIEKMEDIVTRMQRAKTYILHTQILTQKTSASLQEKRVVEASILLSQLVHEKAKLYLRHAKQEKLLEKCQLLNSGIQKAQMLKIYRQPHQSIVSRGTQGDTVSSESSSTCINALAEVPHNEVAAMKEDLEVSERKVANLTRSLHSSLKLKGEPNCADTIIAVHEHFKRRTCCRSLRQDMQMCVIQNLSSRNDHYDIILNYPGLLVQSLKLNVGPDPSILISNNLNDLLITKNFPNINAYAALRFVLKAEISKKPGGRALPQEMQVTHSLLGNVLDVLSEVQTAQIVFHNLPDITFAIPTVEKLELQLHFMNFNIPKKVKLTLDLSCLNRGVYPSEVVPSQFETHSADPLVGAIQDAVKSLRAGHLRIIRLCDCISQAVQAWKEG